MNMSKKAMVISTDLGGKSNSGKGAEKAGRVLYSEIVERQPIEKGWSEDRKYCATTADGAKYLLRVSPLDRKDRKIWEFDRMREVALLGIPMAKPAELGICEEGIYTLESFIEGVDAESFLRALPTEKQYAYGLDAGRILAKIHVIPAPADVPEWETRFNAKIDRKIAMYESCGRKYDNGQPFLTYVTENRYLLADRPQTYQHGDYHIGNMMIDANGILTIIDFDRGDYGDPWEEFNRIVWCAQAAPAFASGMVDGYFDGNVPVLFWRLLALYICTNTLGSLPWSISYGEGEIQIARDQANEILQWYNNMGSPVPTWYARR